MNMTFQPGRRPKKITLTPGLPAPAIVPGEHVFVVGGQGWPERFTMAKADLLKTASLWRLVWTLSVFDIRLRYRGSILGPFWLTLSTAVKSAALGFLYARLFHTDITSYLPFLTLSLVLWGFISTITSEGCACFTAAEGMIRAMRMPMTLHAARVVVRNILVLAHNVVVIVAVFMIMHKLPGVYSWLIIPALALWLVDALAISLILGILCARYRDVPPIVGSVMQIAFFVSPVLWSPSILVHRTMGIILVKWNPFYALLEIVRGPLLGTPLAASDWIAAGSYSLLLAALAVLCFARARARIAFWV